MYKNLSTLCCAYQSDYNDDFVENIGGGRGPGNFDLPLAIHGIRDSCRAFEVTYESGWSLTVAILYSVRYRFKKNLQ